MTAEALPLLAAGRDRRTTARSVVGALIAATLLFTALASKGGPPPAVAARRAVAGPAHAGLDARGDDASAASFDCASFDDEAAYTNATCRDFDLGACNAHCASGWCLKFCGDACARGEGALCAMAFVSELGARCASGVRWSDPAGAGATAALAGARPYGVGVATSRGAADDDASAQAEGCDHHAYCAACGDECRNVLTQHPVGAYVTTINAGPHAMMLLANFSELCAGMLAGPAAARPQPPPEDATAPGDPEPSEA